MATNNFLNTLSVEDMQAVTALSQRVVIPTGTDLYLPGDPVTFVYFPLSGLVSLISVMLNGDQAETAVIGREGAVGLLEARGSGIMLYRAVVQIETTGLKLAVSKLAALDSSLSFRRAVATHLELTIAETRQTVACHAHHPARGRLAWWLLECQDRTGLEALPLTQEFLSAMLGVPRTTVNEVASLLKEEKLIDYRRGVIQILNRSGLERASCECYATIASYRHLIEGRFVGPPGDPRAGGSA